MSPTRCRPIALILAAALALSGVAVASAPSVAAADPIVHDGSAPEQAAASCWEIKQLDGDALDGTYWLQTPALGAPGRFYCDMTTDGGGWVLVARGRDNWTFNTQGQNERYAETVLATNPGGTAAFSPAALPGVTIDGLLDGGAVRDLADGVRVRRALDTAGTDWQEVRLHLGRIGSWTWGFGAGLLADDVIIDDTSYGESNTRDTRTNHRGLIAGSLAVYNDHRRLITADASALDWRMGWAYGGLVCGSSSATSFLYSTGTSNCYAKPFAQVFVRPTLTQADLDYTPLGLTRVPEQTALPLVDARPQTLLGGVTGYTESANWDNHEVRVWAITEIGDTIYVGGSFKRVEDLENDATIDQEFLAAFERDTGRHIPTFAPVVEDTVYDLVATADGRLAVAGEFRDVNGVAHTGGFTVLDPITGAPDETWRSSIADVEPWVQSLDTDGTWIYLSGDFAHMQRDDEVDFRVFRVARVNAATGEVDWQWRPGVNGKVVEIDADGDRVHLAGQFSAVNDAPNSGYRTSVDTVTGAPLGGHAPYEPSDHRESRWYQQAILGVGDRVFSVGSQHNMHMLDRDDLSLIQSHITWSGGDFQSVGEINGVIYASCHCGAWDYEGSNDYFEPAGEATTAHRVNYMLAFDAETGSLLPWVPQISMSTRREGPWEQFTDSLGCLWIGGDLTRGRWNGTGYDRAPGFSRHCPTDSTAPPTPSGFSATLSDDDVLLNWSAVADPSGVVYEVWRDDRVHAVVAGTGYTDLDVTMSHTYAVRAVDRSGNGTGSGNKSASTIPRTISIVPPVELLPVDATWSYFDADTDPGAAWNEPGTDLSSWATGPAPLGFGDGDETTTVDGAALTLQAVTTFDVDPSQLTDVSRYLLNVVADDGAAVHLNGELLDAWNLLGDAPYDHERFAAEPVFGAAERTPRVIGLPSALLIAGTNTIAVEVHQSWRNNPDGFLSVQLVEDTQAPADTLPPEAPAVSAVATAPTSIDVAWDPPADNGLIDAYLLTSTSGLFRFIRDGGPQLVTDTVEPGATHTYSVVAFDAAGNPSPIGLDATTTPDPVVAEEVLAPDADWRFVYPEAGLAPGWADVDFDDTAWATGPALLGFGDTDIATDISTGPAPRPLTVYARSTFELGDPTALSGLTLDIIRDDGVVVYVNGVEVGRDNLPEGTIDGNTFALSEIVTADERQPLVVQVPRSTLVAGTNTIAVEVHANYRGTPDLALGVRAETVPI